MSSPKPPRDEITKANQRNSRPEDPDTQRLKRGERLLRTDTLPEGTAATIQGEDWQEDSETEDALRRATENESSNE
jgi:hypothetical protein